MNSGAARGGRRPGESGTREAILTAARGAFAELGYDRATIRGIAAVAEVDPALVLHYFTSKERLFGAALEIPRPSPQDKSASRMEPRMRRMAYDSKEAAASGL